jgi:hypothetical protein
VAYICLLQSVHSQYAPQMKKSLLLILGVIVSGLAFGATFTVQASGSWSTPGTWNIVGADTDGIPDLGDDVVINAAFTVTLTLTNNSCRDLTVSAGTLLLNNRNLRLYGNVTRTAGTISGNSAWAFYSPSGVITGTFTNSGNWYFNTGTNITIAAGSVIQKNSSFIMYQNSVITNNGILRFTAGSISFSHASAQFINGANSTLQVADDISGPGILNCSANPNTMIYNSSLLNTIRGLTYHHLRIQNTGATSPMLQGAITVNGDLTLISTTLNCNNQNITLTGNWINNAGTTCTNQNQITFNGTGTQTITRTPGNTESFNQVNITGSGTVTLGDTLEVNGLLNLASGTLDVSASNYNLHCRGDFDDNSTFNARQGRVFMDGSAAQVIDGVSATTFYNLTINNASGVSVNFTRTISNILQVDAGTFGPSVSGTIIIPATGATTGGRIGVVAPGAALTGTFQVQTFVNGPATAYWQYLSSPTQGSTIADWDSDTRFFMSGTGGNDGNACCPVFRSVRTYNEPTNTYTNVTTQTQPLIPGQGFMVWMSDNNQQLNSPLIFDTRGTPNFGTINRAVTAGGAGGGYNLVGNPYACPIDYATVVSSSSASLSGSFLIIQENGSYATNPNGGTIAGAQGFMCVASTSGDITFTESCKSHTAAPNVVRAMAGNQIRIKAGNVVNGLGEETTIQLDPMGNEAMELAYDLPYLASPYDNATHIWSQNTSGEQFILNNIGTAEDHLLIPLTVETTTPGGQLLTFKDLNTVTEYNCAWLEDLSTGARINLNSTDTYTFEEPQMGAKRSFVLHLERTNDCTSDLTATHSSLEAQTGVFVSNGQVFASFEFATEEIVTMSMYDLNGKMVMGETTMNVGTQNIAVANPDAHGVYLLRIVKGSEVTTKKFYY